MAFKNFIDKCLDGEAKPEDIDDYVEEWHDGNSDLELNEFLGMTFKEYGLWLLDDSELSSIIKSRKH
jgi:hypothetical protein